MADALTEGGGAAPRRTGPVAPDPASGRYARQNLKLLNDLLAEAVDYLDGPEPAALIERARAAAVVADGRDQALTEAFSTVTNSEAVFLARAFACQALLADLADDAAGRRRHADFDAAERDGLPRTLGAAAAALVAEGETPASIADALKHMHVVPVLTAHPTEVRRRSMVDREFEITRLMSMRRHYLPKAVDERIRADLFREVALLWRTRLHRTERITVVDEIKNALAIVERSLLPALEELYARWSEELGGEGAFPRVLRLGSWLGGDRDGHPGVDACTLKVALSLQANLVFGFYAEKLERLEAELTLSTTLAAVTPELTALADASGETSVQREDEPYRRALIGMRKRLTATRARLTDAEGPPAPGVEPYPDSEALIADLEVLKTSLLRHGGERLVSPTLKNLLLLARCCGFHLLSLDLRQNADVHERVVAELLAKASVAADYRSLDEAARVKLLTEELSHGRLLRSPFVEYSPETAKELAILDAAADALRRYGPRALGSYLVSKSADVSDILEPYVLLKQAGVTVGGDAPHTALQVAPLFETIGDLRNAPGVVLAWLRSPTAKALLGPAPVQEIMLGYSDSSKDGGYVTSRHEVVHAASAVAEVCRAEGVAVQFFHGRGGSVARGGGPAPEAVLAQPPGTVQGRIRLTEQGEMIARKYGDAPTARRNLDSLVAAVLLATKGRRAEDATDPAHLAAMDALSDASFHAYRELVYDEPGFEDFFWSATPVAEIAGLKIGSRPASRSNSRKIEDLRAIPWVFSWSQARFMLPSWYGFASGAARAGLTLDLLRDMAEGWDFFGVLLSNMELALAQADMGMARRYAGLVEDRELAERIFSSVEREYDAACALALGVRGGTRLLDNQPELAESVAAADAFVDPLNRLQLELLCRRRRGDEDPAVQLGVQMTVSGIAAGLRNSG